MASRKRRVVKKTTRKKTKAKRKATRKKKATRNKPASTTKRSLADYRREAHLEEVRAKCPVCKLPHDVREQLATARSGGGYVPRSTMLAWLNKELGYRITEEALDAHTRGRHDSR